MDPYQEVSTNAQTIVDYITALLLESPFEHLDSAFLGYAPLYHSLGEILLNLVVQPPIRFQRMYWNVPLTEAIR